MTATLSPDSTRTTTLDPRALPNLLGVLLLAFGLTGGCSMADQVDTSEKNLNLAAAYAVEQTPPLSDAELDEDERERLAEVLEEADPVLVSRAGGVEYPEVEVQRAVLECMNDCGKLGEITDASRTCELRCANSAWTSVHPEACTVDCMTQMYSCRADCSREVDRPTDVSTCGLSCASVAQLCLRDSCPDAE